MLLVFLFSYILWYVVTYKKNAFMLPMILSLAFVFNYQEKRELNNDWGYHTAVVNNVYSTSITVKEEGEIYYLYGDIDPGLVKGDTVSYSTKYYNNFEKGSFDIFYKSTGAIGAGKVYDFEVIEHCDNYRAELHNELYNDESYYSDITLLMLYGEPKGYGIYMDNKINKMGISHLFVVSGFHISLFFIILDTLGNTLIKNKKIVLFSSFGISLGFLYMIYFPPTGIRALLTTFFVRVGAMDRIEALSITGLIFFVLNPWIMLSSSMILSFSITLAIYIYRPREHSILDMITLSMFAFFISLPTISTWESNHNIFAPLLSMVMTPIVSMCYVIALVVLPFHGVWALLDPLFGAFYYLVIIFSQICLMFTSNLLTTYEQIFLTGMSLYLIHTLRFHKYALFSIFFSISLIVFLI